MHLVSSIRPDEFTAIMRKQNFLLVKVNRINIALPVMNVIEATSFPPQAVELPAAGIYRYQMLWNGTPVPVIDLRSVLGLPLFVPTEESVVVMMNMSQKYVGLLVDTVHDVSSIDRNGIVPMSEKNPSPCDQLMREQFCIQNERYHVLNIGSLMRWIRR